MNSTHDPKNHDQHDGIVELDNPAPFWWQGAFYATIVFSVLYALYYTVGEGPSHQEQFQRAWTTLENQQVAAAGKQSGPDENRLLAMVKDEESLKSGKAVFASKCAACHGPAGQGLIGPNLTDDAWINGDGKVASIYKIVDEGVPAKGMPAWRPMLTPKELTTVVAYVRSIRGSNPAGAKAPQGETHKE